MIRLFVRLAAPAIAFVFFSCNASNGSAKKDGGSVVVTTPGDTSTAPVETRKANTNYAPAFAGQTRIKGVHTKTPYVVETLAEGLDHPWAVTPLADGRLLITSKTGYMQLHDAKGKLVTKIEGFPKVDNRGQGGMLDVAPDPAFAQNHMIYWTFSEPQEQGNLMAVAKGKLSADFSTVENPVVIFRATPALDSKLHFGSRILFAKDGNIFVSTGERSILEGRKQAPWLNSSLGKIFKITPDGQPAPGNPFIGKADAVPQIYSYGHRNVQGLAFHPATGDLWETEFGPMGGDELNRILPGKNYGWPTITYGLEYSGKEIGDAIQQKDGLEQPVYYWDPVLSPSGMDFYAGDAIPEWKNNLFIGGLNSTHVARIVISNNKVVGEERLLADKNERMRDVAYSANKLYVITDSGKLYCIRKN